VNSNLRWFKSSYSSSAGGECLEAAVTPDVDAIRIRDSKDPDGPVLSVSAGAWAAFLPTAPLTH
jgi:hypothetical protein